ncbi:MAG: hypothetical protein ACR2ND_05455, partial [Solirubrobacteraceae bacterium]
MSQDRITEADIAALADGELSDARRAHVERAVEASSELAGGLAEQRHIARLVRAAQPSAPGPLHARVRDLLHAAPLVDPAPPAAAD